MLTIRQYNKIIHDWIVLMTGLNGSYVRPQKNEFGFNLVDNTGKPIAFDSTVCMFYVGFDDRNITNYYKQIDSVQSLKQATVTITVIGTECDNYISQIQSLAMCETSREYLRKNGFAIQGTPVETINDRNYSSKWFYRRTLKVTLNTVLSFDQPNGLNDKFITDIPTNTEILK